MRSTYKRQLRAKLVFIMFSSAQTLKTNLCTDYFAVAYFLLIELITLLQEGGAMDIPKMAPPCWQDFYLRSFQFHLYTDTHRSSAKLLFFFFF